MTGKDAMLSRATQFLAAAESELEASRLETSFSLARTAAELAGKALLLDHMGHYPEGRHDIGGLLAQQGLVPSTIDKAKLADLLARSTRGAYGFNDPVPRKEAARACLMAQRLLDAARKG